MTPAERAALMGLAEEWDVSDEYNDFPNLSNRGLWVLVIAEIRHNESGVIREYQDSMCIDKGEYTPNCFMWEEGNYSCDCNRKLFFARAAGESEDWDSECSDGQYSVRIRNKKSGEVFYDELRALLAELDKGEGDD